MSSVATMSSQGTPPCTLCRTNNLQCEIGSGRNWCRSCHEHGVPCSLFYITPHECTPCVIAHKKCHTRYGQTVCAWCEGKDWDCVPAPTDSESKKQLREPKYKTQSQNPGSPRTAAMAPKKDKKVDKKKKEASISGSGPSTPPSRSRLHQAYIEDEEEDTSKPAPPRTRRQAYFQDEEDAPEPAEYPVFPLRPGLNYDPRDRVLPIPDDYVPPSLPMLDADSPPKSPPENKPVWAPIDMSVPLPSEMTAVIPPEELAELMKGEEELAFNPTEPLPDDPTLPTFMCCNKVVPLPYKDIITDGHLLLKKFFKQFAHYYPIDSGAVDSAECWKHNALYLAISDGDISKHAEIYAIIDLNKGYLCHMGPIRYRAEIGDTQTAKDASNDRFFRVPGGLDLKCDVHGSNYVTYFIYFLAKGQEYIEQVYYGKD